MSSTAGRGESRPQKQGGGGGRGGRGGRGGGGGKKESILELAKVRLQMLLDGVAKVQKATDGAFTTLHCYLVLN